MTEKILIELQKNFNEIGKLQLNLPNKRGKKDYYDVESTIVNEATFLKNQYTALIRKIREENRNISMLSEIENILAGATEVERDPYNKVIVVHLD